MASARSRLIKLCAMPRQLLNCQRSSRLVSLVCVLSLCVNVFFLTSSRHVSHVTNYQHQEIASFRPVISEQLALAEQERLKITDEIIRDELTLQGGNHSGRELENDSAESELPAPSQKDSTNDSFPQPASSQKSCKLCPYDPPNLLGPLADMTQEMTPETLMSFFPDMKGGHLQPSDCVARQKIAIVIPYRNRYPHLHIFLHNLFPFLIRQQADFTVFVIEQALPETFNRGALLNVGFLEAEKLDSFDCFVFHDVDLIPLDDRHLYRCGDNPKHLAVAMNKYHYRIAYKEYFGGAVSFSKRQFLDINGCSNVYFGWGGEDDDMRDRVLNKGYSVTRSPVTIARYDMIKHTRDKGNEVNPTRKKLLATSKKRQDVEGLNSIRYTVHSVQLKPLYVWINVTLNRTEIMEASPSYILKTILEEEAKATALAAAAAARYRNSKSPRTSHSPSSVDKVTILSNQTGDSAYFERHAANEISLVQNVTS